MPNGFFGRILEVDLEAGQTRVTEFAESEARKYFLGSGLAARRLFDDFEAALGPLHPDVPLYFMSGIFTSTPLPGTSKLSVCCRSPQTGIWNEATVGGHWPAEFRRTGLDGICIVGRAAEPVYLHITAGGAEIRRAGHLWGRDAYETGDLIRSEVSKRARVATIGPAGEQGVLISSIIFDPPNTRVAARGGIGAVMGAKNLKAVVVEGDPKSRLPLADPQGLNAHLKDEIPRIRKNTQGLHDFGTSGGVVTVEAFGDLPIRNWKLGSWTEGARRITGQTIQPGMLDHHYACYACPIRCGKIYRVADKGLFGHGPEYETLGMLGANCLVDDPLAIVQANELCNRYGIDTISAGAVVAFGLEAFERGLITTSETEGVPLHFDAPSMLYLVNAIGRQEGVGRLLGKGVRQAAVELGRGAEEFAVHTKGLEYPAHDPRGHVSMALNYATAVRGACHLEALSYFLDRGVKAPDFGYVTPPDPHRSDDKPPIVVTLQNYLSVFNPLGMCKFLFLGGVGPVTIGKWLGYVCGWDVSMADVMLAGERLFNLKRMYNVRLGISRKDDVLPPRLYAGAKPDGRAKGVLPDLGNMLYHYYQLRGWDDEGLPTREKLDELGLSL
jgi:aldehyde:ferredoxin oxidoreductase